MNEKKKLSNSNLDFEMLSTTNEKYRCCMNVLVFWKDERTGR